MSNLCSELICPACKNSMNIEEKTMVCNDCGRSYPIRGGIPYFVEKELYWGEQGITAETMAAIITQLENRNWNDVLLSSEVSAVRTHHAFISNLRRADWHRLLNLGQGSVILDLGAGMGTISQALSSHYSRIFAVEPVALRCEFMKHRFEQEEIKNITVVRADSTCLPFRENFFDHIVLNGVLEWVPYSYKRSNPRAAQMTVLKTLRSLLKDGGTISVGIENRFDINYFLGVPDPHVGVKFATVLPRFLAHGVCKVVLRDIYRPYLYSARGIKKIFSEAGFGSIVVYNSIPSYNEPEFTIRTDSKDESFEHLVWPTRNRMSLTVKRIFVSLGVLRYFGPSYRVVASRK